MIAKRFSIRLLAGAAPVLAALLLLTAVAGAQTIPLSATVVQLNHSFTQGGVAKCESMEVLQIVVPKGATSYSGSVILTGYGQLGPFGGPPFSNPVVYGGLSYKVPAGDAGWFLAYGSGPGGCTDQTGKFTHAQGSAVLGCPTASPSPMTVHTEPPHGLVSHLVTPALCWSPMKLQQKEDAYKAEVAATNAYQEDMDSYNGLGCGMGGSSSETTFACAGIQVKMSYDHSQATADAQLVADPRDRHFHQIAKPRPARVRKLPRRYAAINTVNTDLDEVVALESSIYTSLNREGTAHVAHQLKYVKLQRSAIVGYGRRIVGLVSAIKKRTGQAESELLKSVNSGAVQSALKASFHQTLNGNKDLARGMTGFKPASA